MNGVEILSKTLILATAERALQSPRKRTNFNFHAGASDNPHRMLNALARGTYVRPHRHISPPKSEAFLALKGRAGILCFDESGLVCGKYLLDPDGEIHGVDIAPGVWHTVIALSDVCVCYEVKPGPWEPGSDKDFAIWAPEEGDPTVLDWVASWEALFS